MITGKLNHDLFSQSKPMYLSWLITSKNDMCDSVIAIWNTLSKNTITQLITHTEHVIVFATWNDLATQPNVCQYYCNSDNPIVFRYTGTVLRWWKTILPNILNNFHHNLSRNWIINHKNSIEKLSYLASPIR